MLVYTVGEAWDKNGLKRVLRTGCAREVEQMRDVMKRWVSGAPGRRCMAGFIGVAKLEFCLHSLRTANSRGECFSHDGARM